MRTAAWCEVGPEPSQTWAHGLDGWNPKFWHHKKKIGHPSMYNVSNKHSLACFMEITQINTKLKLINTKLLDWVMLWVLHITRSFYTLNSSGVNVFFNKIHLLIIAQWCRRSNRFELGDLLNFLFASIHNWNLVFLEVWKKLQGNPQEFLGTNQTRFKGKKP